MRAALTGRLTPHIIDATVCLRKPVIPNQFDACLYQEARMWNFLVANGGLQRICCPNGRPKYLTKPWVAMPKEGRQFKPIAYLAVPAPPFTGANLPVLAVFVPFGYDGVISDVVFNITAPGATGFIDGSGDITWRLSADGRYLRDLGNVQTAIGSLITPSPVPRGGLRVYSRDKLLVTAAFTPGAEPKINPSARIVVSITGWFYPR